MDIFQTSDDAVSCSDCGGGYCKYTIDLRGCDMSPSFDSEVIEAEVQEDGTTYMLTKPLVYTTCVDPNKYGFHGDAMTVITVPVGFITDFASDIRPFWSIVPPTGIYDRACAVHDYLYTYRINNRKWADCVLREALKVCGVSFLERWVMFLAVRLFGASHWGP